MGQLTREYLNTHTGIVGTIADPTIPAECFLLNQIYPTGKIGYVAAGFYGKRQKSSFYIRFSTQEARAQYCNEWLEGQRRLNAEKMAYRAKAKRPHTLKVGDILASSWGYDQTNVNFYRVTHVVSIKSVRIVELNTVTNQSGAQALSGTAVAGDTVVGKEMIKRVDMSGDVPEIKIESYEWAHLWDGRPMRTSWGH